MNLAPRPRPWRLYDRPAASTHDRRHDGSPRSRHALPCAPSGVLVDALRAGAPSRLAATPGSSGEIAAVCLGLVPESSHARGTVPCCAGRRENWNRLRPFWNKPSASCPGAARATSRSDQTSRVRLSDSTNSASFLGAEPARGLPAEFLIFSADWICSAAASRTVLDSRAAKYADVPSICERFSPQAASNGALSASGAFVGCRSRFEARSETRIHNRPPLRARRQVAAATKIPDCPPRAARGAATVGLPTFGSPSLRRVVRRAASGHVSHNRLSRKP